MADKGTYYYLKLKEGFFGSADMLLLQGMPDGYIYSDILLKLYLLSLRQEGRLMYRGIIPYTPEMIASVTHHQVGTVEKAMRTLTSMGFIEILDNGAIYMMDIQNFIGKSSDEADRKREYRASITAEKLKLSEKNTGQMSGQISGHLSDKRALENRDKRIENKDINNTHICPEMNSGQPQPKVEKEPVAENGTKVEKEPSCSQAELMAKKEPIQADVFIKLPLINGDDYLVTREYVRELQELYPAVNVEQALRSMRGWLDANPKNRKTPRGIKRFITGWIAREQDKAPRVEHRMSHPAQNNFNNFPQREYDFDELERQLTDV